MCDLTVHKWLIGNTRKALSIVLSFLFFPKPFSWLYVFGGVFVFGSLIATELTKEYEKKAYRKQSVDGVTATESSHELVSLMQSAKL